MWNASCDCGTTLQVQAAQLTKKRPTRSCGCSKGVLSGQLSSERAKKRSEEINRQGKKTCRKCGKEFPLDEFKIQGVGDGHYPRCRECLLDYRLKRTYGIGIEWKRYHLRQQGGVCRICKCALSVLSARVDHCHKTGDVRGLLCDKCNIAVGFVFDNARIAENLVDYLRRFNESVEGVDDYYPYDGE